MFFLITETKGKVVSVTDLWKCLIFISWMPSRACEVVMYMCTVINACKLHSQNKFCHVNLRAGYVKPEIS